MGRKIYEPVFFPDWIDRVISFDSNNDWKITNKLTEHNNQSNAWIYKGDPRPMEAWGVFECVNGAMESAIMKIYMQIPYAGSEAARPNIRRPQASTHLARYSRAGFPALITLTQNGCKSAPTLLDWKKGEQND
ncbi:hypothetical protein EIK77_007723 [Talaromyces pinophilus]|jgi:hypothetical protein|nr:hypothetical protein EIK77_007723 [Talaromyces pinophilus]